MYNETGYKQDGKSQLTVNQTVVVKERDLFSAYNGTSKQGDFNLVQNYQLLNGSASVSMDVLMNETILFSADLVL